MTEWDKPRVGDYIAREISLENYMDMYWCVLGNDYMYTVDLYVSNVCDFICVDKMYECLLNVAYIQWKSEIWNQ